MKRIGIVAAMILILVAGSIWAVDVPNTFRNGEAADADEVNENFQALADAINTADGEYIGESPVFVDQGSRAIGLNAATNANDVLLWDGNNWVSRRLPPEIAGNNMQPFLAINFVIAIQGLFPSRNAEPFLAEIMMFAGNFAPRGYAFCDGQLLAISQNQALFSLLGTTYGGDGETTFGLPDLRGRAPLHQGSGPGLAPRTLGQKGGTETVQ